MTIQPPIKSDNGASVVKFMPRRPAAPPWRPDNAAAHPKPQAAKHHSLFPAGRRAAANDGDDDYRHRMLTNLAAFVFAAVLTAAGIWLAIGIADLRRTQDCALTGRLNCAPVIVSGGGPR